jgi:hypothetical protein
MHRTSCTAGYFTRLRFMLPIQFGLFGAWNPLDAAVGLAEAPEPVLERGAAARQTAVPFAPVFGLPHSHRNYRSNRRYGTVQYKTISGPVWTRANVVDLAVKDS